MDRVPENKLLVVARDITIRKVSAKILINMGIKLLLGAMPRSKEKELGRRQ